MVLGYLGFAQEVITVNGKSFSGNKGYIYGKLIDKETNEEIIGAIVTVPEYNEATVTDINGEFRLRVPQGDITVKANTVGFDPGVFKLRVLGSGNFRIYLNSATTELEEVVVTGFRKDANVKSTDIGKNSLSIESIKQLPMAMGEVDIIKSLTLLPGVNSNSVLSTGFNVRGGSSDQNLILLGDVPIYNPAHLFGFYTAFNADVVDDVTLYKGGVPAQYGGRASSVLHVKYRDGDYTKWKAKVTAGVVTSKFSLEGPIIKDKLSILGTVRKSYVNYLLKSFKNVDVQNSAANFYDFNVLVNYKLNKRNKISYALYKSADNFNLAGDTVYQWSNFNQTINWTHSFNEKLSFKATGALSQYDNTISNKSQINPFALNSSIENKIANLDLEYLFSESLTFNAGVNFTETNLNPGVLNPIESKDNTLKQVKTQTQHGRQIDYFLNSKYELNEKITISAGIRYNTYSYLGKHKIYVYQPYKELTEETIIDSVKYGAGQKIATYSGWEPRLAINFGLTESSSIKLGYNRMYQYINLISNTTTIAPNNIWKLSDNQIKPQIADQVSLGYYKNFNNNMFETSIEGFYKGMQNVLDYKDGANLFLNDHIETDVLQGQGKSYGVELFLKKKSGGRLTGWISYTLSRSLRRIVGAYENETINNGNWYSANFERIHNFSNVLIYKLPKKWEFSSTFTFKTGRPVSYPAGKIEYHGQTIPLYVDRNTARQPLYHRLDISFTKKFIMFGNKPSEFNFSVYNVYGRKNPFSVYFQDVSGSPPQPYKLSILGVPFPSASLTINL